MKAYKHESGSIFVLKCDGSGACQLKDGLKFTFYTSHLPCGDASIFPIKDAKDSSPSSCQNGNAVSLKRKIDDKFIELSTPAKQIRLADNNFQSTKESQISESYNEADDSKNDIHR